MSTLVAGDNTLWRPRLRGLDGEYIDLTGMTVKGYVSVNGGAPKGVDLTPDPDQATNTGRATYRFEDADLEAGVVTLDLVARDGSGNEWSRQEPRVVPVRARTSGTKEVA